jgi:hypothetical protein
MEAIPLFAEPPRPGVAPARAIAKSPNPAWSRYVGPRVACDECVIFLHENAGAGPLPRSARLVRTVRAAGERLRFCTEHAALRKAADVGCR